jgi:hypothetical protein
MDCIRKTPGLLKMLTSIVGNEAEDIVQDALVRHLTMTRSPRELENDSSLHSFSRLAMRGALKFVKKKTAGDRMSRYLLADTLVSMTDTPEERLNRLQELNQVVRDIRALPATIRTIVVMREVATAPHHHVFPLWILPSKKPQRSMTRRVSIERHLARPPWPALSHHGHEISISSARRRCTSERTIRWSRPRTYAGGKSGSRAIGLVIGHSGRGPESSPTPQMHQNR